MIHLSRLHDNGSIVINADLIETMEACPDTTITLVTKRKFVVADPLEDVISRIVDYRARVSAVTNGAIYSGSNMTQATYSGQVEEAA